MARATTSIPENFPRTAIRAVKCFAARALPSMLQRSTQETRRDARQPSPPLDRHARSLPRRDRRRRPHHPGRGGGALAQGYPYPGATRRHRGDACLGRTARSAAADAEAALGAGADRRGRGLARAARPAVLPHPHLRPRHTPRVDGREHPWRAVPPHQALCGHRRGPEAGQVGPSRRHTTRRPDAGHPRSRRDRSAGSPDRRCDRHARDRHEAARRGAARGGGGGAAGTDGRGAGAVRLRSAAAARDAGNRQLHERAPAGADEADRLAAELRSRPSDRRRRSGRRGAGEGHCRGDARCIPPGAAPGRAPVLDHRGDRRAAPYRRRPPAARHAPWPGCSWTTWCGSSMAGRSGRWSTEPQGISATSVPWFGRAIRAEARPASPARRHRAGPSASGSVRPGPVCSGPPERTTDRRRTPS